MKRKLMKLFAMAALLIAPAAAMAQTELTVADGTATNANIPVYGYYVDEAQHNQILYPGDSLEEMTGGIIGGLTFYMSSQSSNNWNTTVTISLATTDVTSLSGLNSTAVLTQVWQGTWSGQSDEISVEFDNEFTYEGGNLLVDIATTEGAWGSASFYGANTDATLSYRTYGGYSNSGYQFLPRTMFSYIPGSGDFCYKPKAFAVSDITTDGATVSWTQPYGGGNEYAVFVDGEYVTTVSDTFYTISGYSANTLYSVAVKNVCAPGDSSSALNGSFRTLCGSDMCDMVFSTSSYSASITIWQNGSAVRTLTGSQTVQICAEDSLFLVNRSGSWTVTDAGDTQLELGSGDTVYAAETGCPTCIPPANLHVSDADTDYFTFTWDPISNAEGYIVYFDSVEVSDNPVTDTFYTFSVANNDLVPMQRYSVWVRAYCGGDDTSAYRRATGTTSCSMAHINADDEAEFVETLVGLDGTFGGSVSASADHTASNALLPCWYFSNNYVWLKNQEITFESGHADAYLCLPVMDAPVNTLEITWTGKIGNVGDSPDSVVLGVADFSGENVVWLDTIFYSEQSRASWVDHPWYALDQYGYEGDGVRIAFKVLFSSNWNAFKNFHVRQIPQCTAPTNPTGHNYTNADSTFFTWIPQGSAEEWQVALGTPEDDPDGLSLTTVTEPNYVIPAGSLTMGEQYTFWLRANCGDVQSEWKSHTFYSGTAIMPASGTDTVSGCGVVVYDNGYQGPYPSNYHNSTIVVRPAQAGQLVGISSFAFSNYCYDGYCQGSVTVYDGEGTNGTVLYTASSYDTITDTILGEEGAITIQLSGGQYAGQGIEAHTFCTDAPTCIRPKHLAVSNVETTTATLSWDNANATDYIIYYKVDTAETWETINASGIDDSTYTFDEGTFEPNTRYSVKLAGDCGGGDVSLQSTEVSFRTPCLATVIDDENSIVESFEGSEYPAPCFTIDGNTSLMTHSSDQAYAGSQSFRFMYAYSNADAYLISPLLSATELMSVKFMYKTYSTTWEEPFAVGYSTTDANIASFTWGTAMNATNTGWEQYFDTIPADAKYIAIHQWGNGYYLYVDSLVVEKNDGTMPCLPVTITVGEVTDSTITVTVTGGDSIYVAIEEDSWDFGGFGESSTSYLAEEGTYTFTGLTAGTDYIIGARVLCSENNYSTWATADASTTGGYNPPTPTYCEAPTNLTATPAENEISISFSGSATSYQVGIFAGASWDEGSATIVDIDSTNYTFNGLTASTQYTIGVRSVCEDEYYGDIDYSDWVTTTVSTTSVPEECNAPTNVHTASVDSNRAVIAWTAGGNETEWQLMVNNDQQNLIDATSTTYVMNSLTPNTQYKVRVRAVCSATATSDWSAELTFTTDSVHQGGNEGITSADGIVSSIYPNPASSVVSIEASAEAMVSIVDLNGREVYRSVNSATEHRVDVSRMAKGAYFVRIVTEEGTAVRKLIVR